MHKSFTRMQSAILKPLRYFFAMVFLLSTLLLFTGIVPALPSVVFRWITWLQFVPSFLRPQRPWLSDLPGSWTGIIIVGNRARPPRRQTPHVAVSCVNRPAGRPHFLP
ncbi:MAG: hypothetical protein WCK92_13795 [Bacteroidota bacterium]